MYAVCTQHSKKLPFLIPLAAVVTVLAALAWLATCAVALSGWKR
jgi:hypothetical protein